MREIYLDNAATTRVDDDTAAVALELMLTDYGNPSSLHAKGLAAQMRVDKARQQLASALGCGQEELVFTSGGTESNNLAVFGAAESLGRRGKTIVASAIEHSSVLEPLRQLEKRGFTLRLVEPAPDGRIDADAVLAAVDSDTILVSCMLVNSETGAISPVAEITKGVRRRSPLALVHCDAVQAFCRIPFSASRLGVDLLTVSAHKIHAPKGVGALYIRAGVRVPPRVFGGGQERGVRSGTESAPLACAFGFAAEKLSADRERNFAHVSALRDRFLERAGNFSGLCINSPSDSTPYLCNVSLPGYRSEILLHYLAARGVYVSSGSACSKGASSHVLASMGLSPDRVDSALRVSFCKDNTVQDVDDFFAVLERATADVRPARRRLRGA